MSKHKWHTFSYDLLVLRGRYAFINEDATWNRVRYRSDGNSTYRVVSDHALTEEQLTIIIDKMGMFPGNDFIKSAVENWKLGKHYYKWKLAW